MSELTKSERRLLRELAGRAYEAEAGQLLAELEGSFSQWRKGEKLSSEVIEDIHQFHQNQSRELWSMYRGLTDPEIVSRGIARGLIEGEQIEPRLYAKLELRIEDFRESLE